jgi:hypothetical protein
VPRWTSTTAGKRVDTYLRLLRAYTEGVDRAEVARIILQLDPAQQPERARRAWQSHLARAKWMTETRLLAFATQRLIDFPWASDGRDRAIWPGDHSVPITVGEPPAASVLGRLEAMRK